MIAHLRGRLLRKSAQEVVVDVNGVGYRVLVPVSTLCRLGDPDTEVALLVYTHVREDALALYGFASAAEQTLFEKLIDVAGVGPRLAINILSGIEAEELVTALRQGDLPRLTRIPGVGKKTAERLVLELKDKMATLTGAAAPLAPAGAPAREDLVSALGNLGYTRAEAEKAVDRVLQQDGSGRFEDLLRRALRVLSSR